MTGYLPTQPCDEDEDPNWGVGWGFTQTPPKDTTVPPCDQESDE